MTLDLTQSSRCLIKRGPKATYLQAAKYEGELYYLTDTKQLASHKTLYTSKVDGGYFCDALEQSKFDRIDGGEF